MFESALVAVVVGFDGRSREPLRARDRGARRARRLRPRPPAHGRFAYGSFSAILLVVVLQNHDPQGQRATVEVGVLLLLCGVLGAFTRRLVDELGLHQEAAWDQVTRLTTANELLVALHGVAQTLPASLDLQEVIDSTRTRLRSLVRVRLARVPRARRHARRVDRRVRRRASPARSAPRRHARRAAARVLDEGRARVRDRPARRPRRTRLLADGAQRHVRPSAGTRARRRPRRASRTPCAAATAHDDLALLNGLAGPLALAVDNALLVPAPPPLRRRGRTGPHRPRPARPARPVARLHRVRARAAGAAGRRRRPQGARPSCTTSCAASSASCARRSTNCGPA